MSNEITDQQLKDKLVEIDSSDYAQSHYDRFIQSYRFVIPHISDGMKCLDLGSYGHFQKLIQAFHPNIDFPKERNDFDLRNMFPIASSKYDIIFCMEVIEHIKDRDENGKIDLISTYNQSGVNSIMSEMYRVLKKEGLLFLTTPNIGSYMSAHRLLSGYSPTFYLPHVKEWSIKEIESLHANHNFHILRIDTADVFGKMSGKHQDNLHISHNIKTICEQFHYSTDLRKDMIMTLAKKILKSQCL